MKKSKSPYKKAGLSLISIMILLILSPFVLAELEILGDNTKEGVINLEQILESITSFLDLEDTPSSYSGQANKCVAVNDTETGLEFIACSSGGGSGGDASNWSLYQAVSDVDLTGYDIDNGGFITTEQINITDQYLYFGAGYQRVWVGGGNNFYDQDCISNSTSDCNFRFFRFVDTLGAREFEIFKGDGSATRTFWVNADTGHITTASDSLVNNLNADLLDGQNGAYYETTYNVSYDYLIKNFPSLFQSNLSISNLITLRDVTDSSNTSKGNLIWWNETDWREPYDGCGISNTCYVTTNATDDVKFTPPPDSPSTPSLSDVLTSGDTASAGQKIAFRQADVNITSLTDGQLDIGAKAGGVQFWSNFRFASALFNYLVCNNCFAFAAETDKDAGLKFIAAGTNSRFGFTDLAGNEAVNISVFGATSGTTSIKSKLNVGDRLVVGTTTPTPNASFSTGDGWFAGGVYASFFASHSPKLDCLEKESGEYGWYCIVSYIKSGRGDEFTEAEVKVTTNENFTILWSNETLNQEVLNHFRNIEDNQKLSKEYENAKLECESQEFYEFTDISNYQLGSRSCTFVQSVADMSCKDLRTRQDGKYYRYDKDKGMCVLDDKSYCERVNYQIWDDKDKQCEVNEQLECIINGANPSRNQTWDYRKEECVYSPQIDCENKDLGWLWNKDKQICEYDEEIAFKDCLDKGRNYIWKGGECIVR